MSRSTIYTIATLIAVIIMLLFFRDQPKPVEEAQNPAALPSNGLVTGGATQGDATQTVPASAATAEPAAEPAKPAQAEEDAATGDLPADATQSQQ